MTSYLAFLAEWGPPLIYSSKLAYNTLGGTIIKAANPPPKHIKPLSSDICGRVDGVRDDVSFYSTKIKERLVVSGTNWSPSACIEIKDSLIEIADSRVIGWLCKSSLYHIKNGSIFKARALGVAASIGSIYCLPYIQSLLPNWISPLSYLVPFLVASNVYSTAMLAFNLRADAFANRHATNEELHGADDYFQAQLIANRKLNFKYPGQFLDDGNTRGPVDNQPPHTDRLAGVYAELKNRHLEGVIADKEREQKQQSWVRYFENNFRK